MFRRRLGQQETPTIAAAAIATPSTSPPKTPTTARSQLMALLCAPVVESRRETEGESTRTAGAAVPQSLMRWAQSTTAFRAWAEEWVLRPCDEVAFALPIKEHYLFVSVSQTLGIVRHCWFTTSSEVIGCLGHNRVLLKPRNTYAQSLIAYTIAEVGDNDGEAPIPVEILQPLDCNRLFCNQKWMAGFLNHDEIGIWRVCGGVVMEPGHCLDWPEFSPCSEIGMGWRVTVCDVPASFNDGDLVAKSKLLCNESLCGVILGPDGYVYTLHYDFNAAFYFVVDETTGTKLVRFPPHSCAKTVGNSNLLVSDHRQFATYHTGNLTSAPTLCVCCTWASPSLSRQSCLIASTTYNDVSSSEITFAVYDAATGFHHGDFNIHFDPSLFFS
ncbi:hypothetical protein Pelo_2113 [Pelomyxa schiedti]|nr:hypothetical protein Pelo_2113 [Pelomyxa schiedti]